VAKLIAGARVFMPPVAGASALSYPRFLLFDALGSLLWTAPVVGLGALLGREWEGIARGLEQAYRLLGLALVTFIVSYFAWKFVRRHQYGAPRPGLTPIRTLTGEGPSFGEEKTNVLQAEGESR